MYTEIEHYVTHQCTCLKSHRPNQTIRAPFQTVSISAPMELVFIDFIHLQQNTSGYEYILVVVDHFTQFAQAYPCRNKAGHTAARGRPGKLCSYWENEVHIVTAKKCDNPVYEVVPEDTKRKPRVLHSNFLLPCPYSPLNIPAQTPSPKSTKNTQQRSPTPYPSTDDDSDNDKDVNDHISSGN